MKSALTSWPIRWIRSRGTSSPEAGDLVFFFRTYCDAGQDWTHVGNVSCGPELV